MVEGNRFNGWILDQWASVQAGVRSESACLVRDMLSKRLASGNGRLEFEGIHWFVGYIEEFSFIAIFVGLADG